MLYRDFATQEQIDAQYDTAIPVADRAAEMRHYQDRSAHARAVLPCRLGVPYGPTRAETLDIFPADPPDAAGAPVFVFIHGGYWRALSAADFSCVALGLAQRGITVVVPDYALCPAVTVDEIVRQMRAACAWVLRHIAEHGGDPQRVAVGGSSAGGHLAAMCLQTEWARDYGLPQDPFKGAVMASGLYDLAPLRYSFLQPKIQLTEDTVQRCSPVLHVRPSPTPVLLTWGGLEQPEFARQSLAWREAWLAAGNRAELLEQPEAHHFSAIHGFEDPRSALCDWVAAALGR
ncbi:alpha/beta hydrolase [Paracidovorax wautersii]|uniref:Arylformamidase n=1 Tax=Paracidovorax wautersii TaxID=1177982 RepID=A0A1I2BZF8_9BURK|nr:alpha/beta hydrolase [Paracidovorax wautersii]SFE61489.1 arylformamidase [Paracidovorax wautersii]